MSSTEAPLIRCPKCQHETCNWMHMGKEEGDRITCSGCNARLECVEVEIEKSWWWEEALPDSET